MSVSPTWASYLNRKTDRKGSYARRKLAPMVEAVEARTLLSTCVPACTPPPAPLTGTGVLAGNAFVDANCDGKFGPGDAPLAGATVTLYRADGCTKVASQTTGPDGAYKFTGLAAGDYVIKECAPSGYRSTGTEVNSQLNPGTGVQANAIKVTVVDPKSVFVSYQGVDPSKYATADIIVNGNARENAFGPMSIALGTTPGGTDLNDGLVTFCVNDEQFVDFYGGATWQVDPGPVSAINGSAEVGGRIAYLFNHYGNDSLTNVSGPALQLAIWELIYDGESGQTAPDFAGGNFQVGDPTGSTTRDQLDAILAQATSFYNESAGHNEAAVFLETSLNVAKNQQSMLATGTFNFGNKPNCDDGHKDHDHGCDDHGSGCDKGHDHDHDKDKGCDDKGKDKDKDKDKNKGCDDHGRDKDKDKDKDKGCDPGKPTGSKGCDDGKSDKDKDKDKDKGKDKDKDCGSSIFSKLITRCGPKPGGVFSFGSGKCGR